MDNVNIDILQAVEQVTLNISDLGDEVLVQVTQEVPDVSVSITEVVESVNVEIAETVEQVNVDVWDGTRTGVTFSQDSAPIGKEKDTWYNTLTGTFHIYSGGAWKSLVVDGEYF